MTTNEHIENFVRDIKMLNDKELEAVANGVIRLLEAIEKPGKPQIGDRCIFWDDDSPEDYYVSTLSKIVNKVYKFSPKTGSYDFRNCKRLTREAE